MMSYQRVLKNVVHNYGGDVYNVLFSNIVDYSKNAMITPEHPLYSMKIMTTALIQITLFSVFKVN